MCHINFGFIRSLAHRLTALKRTIMNSIETNHFVVIERENAMPEDTQQQNCAEE